MTCYENVHLAVRQVFRTLSAAELKDKTEEALRLVHLDHAMHKYPYEISGGMKQRVGIARALAARPRALLLDEPFGTLDALIRANLQDELVRIVEATRSTVVMVTHDLDEAILLSDRIVMMTNGPAATIGNVLQNDLPRPRDRDQSAIRRLPPAPAAMSLSETGTASGCRHGRSPRLDPSQDGRPPTVKIMGKSKR